MAQAITLARPYARAAFELARASGALPAWSQALAFAAAVAKDARVAALGNDPRVLPEQLVALHLPQGMDAQAPFAGFLAELAEHRRMALLPEVADLFEQYKREAESQLLVKVTSAMALDAAQAEQLKASLKRRFKRDIELETQVDASLLGGVVIDTGSEVIDGSVRGRLARLSGALTA
ncbi:F-type H+-transporting ATPase subunit delta [Dyella sp. SG562]|jgi:F-type H+-transporting ATPase subunit delta|uniref:F0F1 ATP synthase subunit delta n=1 Tax=Dyella TaxID=231454 RepID=UPI001423C10A|nr:MULTISPECIES: F0F1 ATP synthase subunit delta [unclassified Dyella]NII72583.1 F-type H+-transporting ATPase subunit delta [Dyella sp. SG562]NKJ21888.1 F-type H+-transporting ATPase subunit delta [Dyella sp. SG609]